jgi:hypothetical protein
MHGMQGEVIIGKYLFLDSPYTEYFVVLPIVPSYKEVEPCDIPLPMPHTLAVYRYVGARLHTDENKDGTDSFWTEYIHEFVGVETR